MPPAPVAAALYGRVCVITAIGSPGDDDDDDDDDGKKRKGASSYTSGREKVRERRRELTHCVYQSGMELCLVYSRKHK